RELVAFAAALNDLFDWPGPIAPLWGTRVQQYAQATGLFNRVVDELLEGGMHWLRYQRWHELTSLVERLEACIQEAKARYLTARAEVAHAPAQGRTGPALGTVRRGTGGPRNGPHGRAGTARRPYPGGGVATPARTVDRVRAGGDAQRPGPGRRAGGPAPHRRADHQHAH